MRSRAMPGPARRTQALAGSAQGKQGFDVGDRCRPRQRGEDPAQISVPRGQARLWRDVTDAVLDRIEMSDEAKRFQWPPH